MCKVASEGDAGLGFDRGHSLKAPSLGWGGLSALFPQLPHSRAQDAPLEDFLDPFVIHMVGRLSWVVWNTLPMLPVL